MANRSGTYKTLYVITSQVPSPHRKAPVVRRPIPCNTSAVVKAMPLVFPAHVKAWACFFVVVFFYRKGGWGD